MSQAMIAAEATSVISMIKNIAATALGLESSEGAAPLPPLPLPPPPATPGLVAVLMYTFRTCFMERKARLRLAAVFLLVLLSRAMGGGPSASNLPVTVLQSLCWLSLPYYGNAPTVCPERSCSADLPAKKLQTHHMFTTTPNTEQPYIHVLECLVHNT